MFQKYGHETETNILQHAVFAGFLTFILTVSSGGNAAKLCESQNYLHWQHI